MKVLVVVDMQNDFIDGALRTSEAVGIVDKVKAKIKRHLEEGGKVYYTQDTHSPNYLQTAEGQHLPVKHCVEGTEGWEIAPGIYHEPCQVIRKGTFGSLELTEEIAHLPQPLESIELVGLCTDICVISNALILKASLPEIPIIVDAACCAGVTPESHRNALDAMKMCQVEVKE